VTEETTIVSKSHEVSSVKPRDSHLFGFSVRSMIAFMIGGTVCAMSLMGKDVKEPLYTLAGMVVGFYMGAHKPKGTN
jgi:hypothetical protein